jgi:hypothetical protein
LQGAGVKAAYPVRCWAPVLLLASLALCGCVTAKKYRMAKTDQPPAQALDWQATAPGAECTLHSLIVFKGPGSWKREARWDEYVVRLVNTGDQPLRIDAATLVDVLGQPLVPGTDPWQLEKLSYTNWDKYGKTGLKLLAGAGAVTLYAGAVMATTLGGLSGGAAAGGAGVAVLSVIPVVAIVDITAVAVMNHNNKAKVQAEFDRRRLVLPVAVAPGAAVEGSFFFPMAPAPQRLVLKGAQGAAPVELVLGLQPLAGLHLAPPGN